MPERAVELRDALIQALEALNTVQVPGDEIEAWKREMSEMLLSSERGAELGRLDLAATGILLSGEAIPPEQVVEQCLAVTPEGVASVVRRWHETCLAAIPQQVEMPAPWNLVRRYSGSSVTGARVFLPAAHALADHRLLVAPEGVTVEASADVRWTVRWNDCEAVLKHADGSLTAIGADGVAVQLLPGDWIGGEQMVTDLARRVGPTLVVPVETKPNEEATRGLSGLAAVSTGLLVVLVGLLWFSTLVTMAVLADSDTGTSVAAIAATFAGLSGWTTWSLVVRLRAAKDRRALPREPTAVERRIRIWMVQQDARRLLWLEIAAWAVTVLVVLTLGRLLVGVPFAVAALHLRRERQRVAARNPG